MQFGRTMLVLTLAFGISACATSPASAPIEGAPAATSGRSAIALKDGWRFRFGEFDPSAVAAPTFDDGGWEAVSVPHSWNLIGEYALARGGTSNNEQGTGWYRLRVDAPRAEPGMRQYLDFAAIGTIADVWVNGIHAGTHRGAFARFRLDVTEAWQPGRENLVVVRADNSKPAVGSSTENVIPLAGDFFVHGGIYRPAHLIQLSAASIDLLDHGGPGVYVRAAGIEEDSATIEVRTRLRNAGEPGEFEVVTTLRDADGHSVGRATRNVALPGGTGEVVETIEIADPHLWEGVDAPYLYAAEVSLLQSSKVVDQVSETFGIRSFRFDADNGFFLNGRHVKLRGVSRHQDRLGKGWALDTRDHAEDMAIVAEMGANSVRQAHYQHADEWSDEADRSGMVVWAELPYVGTPSLSGGTGSSELWANSEQQLRELIRQNYNHPSIVMWSIGNEVDSAKAFGATEETPSPVDLLRRMEEVAKEEDPYRPTVLADFSEDFGPFGERRQALTGVADLMGYNRYPGWYYVQGAMAGRALGGILDGLHAKHPNLPIGVSEYGAGSGITQFSDDPTNGYVAFAGRPQTEEYAAWVHEQLWPAIAERDYLYGSWVWNMFDFASDLRKEGDSVDINTKGLVSMDRKVRKDAFYYYQAAWTDAPMIHLTGKRYSERSYPVMDVKAYSNAATARLTFNGKDMGEAKCVNFACTWSAVPLRPGANQAHVSASIAGQVVNDTAQWDGIAPSVDGLHIDAGNLAASVVEGQRFGSDTFVEGGTPMPRYIGSIGATQAGEDIPIEADAPSLYDYWRIGKEFTYAIPLTDGDWHVTVHTLQPVETGQEAVLAAMLGADVVKFRPTVMAIEVNGKAVLAKLDVAKAAGGPGKGYAARFPAQAENGILRLTFKGVDGGQATVAAIEITK